MLQDLLQLVAGILWFGGEGPFGNLDAQDVCDHVRAKPANQRGAAGGVVGLPVVEEKPVHLQPDNSESTIPDMLVLLTDT